MTKKLILLFGMPRSGTTWIGKILDSHPLTDYRHEPDSVFTLTNTPLILDTHATEQDASELAEFVYSLEDRIDGRVCGKLPLFPKHWGGRLGKTALGANVVMNKLGDKAGLSLPIARRLLSPPGEGVLVWKSIESLGRLGWLARYNADIYAFLLLRHPCGHVASVLRGQASHQFHAAIDTHRDEGILKLLCESSQGRALGLTIEHLRSLTTEEILAWRWRIFNDHALDQTEGLPNVMTLRYEDICENPQRQSREMFEFVGLTWHQQTQSFIHHSTSHNNRSYYGIHKDPDQSSRSWAKELSTDQQTRIASTLGGSRAASLYGYA